VLVAYALSLVAWRIGQPVGVLDESIQLVSGMLIRDGMLPHVDFWSLYPPLDYYLNAAVFSLLGESVVAARVLQSAFFLAVLGGLVLLALRDFSAVSAKGWLVSLAAALVVGKTFSMALWNAYALGFLGFLAYLLARPPATARRRLLLVGLSGLLIGLSVSARLNFPFYFCVAIGLDLLREGSVALRAAGTERRVREWALRVACFAAPLAACVVGFLVLYRPALPDLVEQSFLFYLGPVMEHRRRTFFAPQLRFVLMALLPPIWIALRAGGLRLDRPRRSDLATIGGLLALALVIVAIGIRSPLAWPNVASALVVAVTFVAGWRTPALQRDEFVGLLAYACFLHYGFTRADGAHFVTLLPIAATLIPAVARLPGRSASRSSPPLLRASLALLLLSCILRLSLTQGFPFVRVLLPVPSPAEVRMGAALLTTQRAVWTRGDSAALTSERAELAPPWTVLYGDRDELAAARFVHGRTSEGDAVYVGKQDHSRTFSTAMRTYWILGRRVGVKHLILEPTLTTEAATQEQMIRDLERNRVEWIILAPNLRGDRDFERRGYRGDDRLDRYIREAYVEVRSFGGYTVLQHRAARAAELVGSYRFGGW
jgi:hypothetical protein